MKDYTKCDLSILNSLSNLLTPHMGVKIEKVYFNDKSTWTTILAYDAEFDVWYQLLTPSIQWSLTEDNVMSIAQNIIKSHHIAQRHRLRNVILSLRRTYDERLYDMAIRLHMSSAELSAVENGHKTFSDHQWKRLHLIYGVPDNLINELKER